jgi:AcrR family transcriptional regulator
MSELRMIRGIRTVVSMRPHNPRLLVMEVAAREFAALGYAGVTVAAIAGLCGVAEGVIYSTFGSKAGLLCAIISDRSST